MKRYVIHLITMIAILTAVSMPDAYAEDRSIESEVDAFLSPIVDEDLISGSILIAKKGEILLAKGYGPANREYGIPNGPDTKHRLGSVTKQFTAMAIMILNDRGLLTVDDTLSKYYPEFPGADRITIHHLLTHTSGVINYNHIEDYGEKMMLPLEIDDVIEWVADKPPVFEPGERFGYSNSGYVLLAGIIEKVSGISYADFLNANIFEPLGMKNSGQDVHTDVIRNRATGHGNTGEFIYQAPYRDMPFTSGAGSLYSTVNDMYLWDQALYTEKLISRASLEKMFRPFMSTYAYGWFVQEAFGRKLITHRGGINGFLSNIDRFVDDSVLIVTLFNYETTFASRVNRGLAAIALGEEFQPLLAESPVEVGTEILDSYVGSYRITPEIVFSIEREGDILFVLDNDGNKLDASAQDENLFFVLGMNAMMRFDRGEDSEVNRVIFMQGAHSFAGERI